MEAIRSRKALGVGSNSCISADTWGIAKHKFNKQFTDPDLAIMIRMLAMGNDVQIKRVRKNATWTSIFAIYHSMRKHRTT